MARLVNILSFCALVVMLLITVCAFSIHYWINAPLNLSEDQIIKVNKGDTLTKVAGKLEQEGVLSSARLLTLYARVSKKTKLEVGEYLLLKQSNPQALLELLQSGDVISYSVTLVEGKTFKDFLQALHRKDNIIATLKDKTHSEIIKSLGLSIAHPEGWFFPDTYQYTSGVSDKDILLQAYNKMAATLDDEWNKKAKNLPYKNAYEALIMASIVEKETGVAYERPEIAGVFVRRLRKGMRLQTDPTIIYGLGDSYKGNIRRKHLRQKTAYNTYVIDGLPPTPIAMPGREAINAALNPKAGKTLYFVAKGDGSHYFSKSLREHNNAVQEYQIRKRAKNYQSAPPKK